MPDLHATNQSLGAHLSKPAQAGPASFVREKGFKKSYIIDQSRTEYIGDIRCLIIGISCHMEHDKSDDGHEAISTTAFIRGASRRDAMHDRKSRGLLCLHLKPSLLTVPSPP